MVLGTTAISSIAAAIANGGTKEQSRYKDDPEFDQTWDTLAEQIAAMPPGVDLILPFDIE